MPVRVPGARGHLVAATSSRRSGGREVDSDLATSHHLSTLTSTGEGSEPRKLFPSAIDEQGTISPAYTTRVRPGIGMAYSMFSLGVTGGVSSQLLIWSTGEITTSEFRASSQLIICPE